MSHGVCGLGVIVHSKPRLPSFRGISICSKPSSSFCSKTPHQATSWTSAPHAASKPLLCACSMSTGSCLCCTSPAHRDRWLSVPKNNNLKKFGWEGRFAILLPRPICFKLFASEEMNDAELMLGCGKGVLCINVCTA